MEKYTSRKGKTGIVLDGFRFRQDRQQKHSVSWRCTNYHCSSRCTTDLQITEVMKQPTEHNHPPESEKTVQRHQIRGELKRKATEHLEERPLKMACTEAIKFESLDFNDAKMLRQSIYRERQKVRPKLPTSMQETCEILNSHESSMVYRIDEEANIVMFATPESVRFLCSTKQMYADGTFYTCPRFFYQMYTFFSFNNGVYAPCVFFLLPNKTRQTYERMMRILLQSFEQTESDIASEIIHIDLETAMVEAIKSTSNLQIKFCHFHVRQSWFRKIQALGLVNDYKDVDSEIGSWLKLFFGLPALEQDMVGDAFAFCLMSRQPDSEKCTAFADYMYSTYISESATFQPSSWTNQNCEGRTTNACESFHKHFKDNFASSRPNIFLFLKHLSEEQAKSSLKMKVVTVNRKRKADREIEEKRIELINLYKQGQLPIESFLEKIAYKMLPILNL